MRNDPTFPEHPGVNAAFNTALQNEIASLKADCQRHIEAAAHKELDWFAEKRRADLLEAKCAENMRLAESWEHDEIERRKFGLATGEYIHDERVCRRCQIGKDNPSPLLERLEKAETDALYGKSLSKELGQKCDALTLQNEKLERVRQLADDYLNVCWTEESRKELQEALATCPKEEE